MENFVVIGYLHTMHRPDYEPSLLLNFEKESPWGKPGKDFDEAYFVTTEPVYLYRPEGIDNI